ncbi:hypothetical protein BRARA_B02806 [Brassica rapa]|nr:hypothetical protein BRARA_B02806 [Brassica rapa]
MVTGESVPVSKEVDSPGSVNMVFFHIKATKVGSDAVLSQIISLVETAQMSKAPIQKFADYVASIFVPVVIALALFTLVGWSIGWLPEKGTHFVFSLMFSISVVGPCLTQGKPTVATAKVFSEMDRGESFSHLLLLLRLTVKTVGKSYSRILSSFPLL